MPRTSQGINCKVGNMSPLGQPFGHQLKSQPSIFFLQDVSSNGFTPAFLMPQSLMGG